MAFGYLDSGKKRKGKTKDYKCGSSVIQAKWILYFRIQRRNLFSYSTKGCFRYKTYRATRFKSFYISFIIPLSAADNKTFFKFFSCEAKILNICSFHLKFSEYANSLVMTSSNQT